MATLSASHRVGVMEGDADRYWAFISYSHRDRRWGQWLHRRLETYRVPSKLVGRDTAWGPAPRRLTPVFRDREELSSSADLGERIEEALRQSRSLIVICSPAAAASRWVNQEVLSFKRLKGADRVLCLIVEGEPNVGDAEARECFPQAVRFDVEPDGSLSARTAEPIAADARDEGDGRRDAMLKLIAGVLSVPFDQLKRREQQRRQRRLAIVTTVTLVLALVMAGLTVWALHSAERAQEQEGIAVANAAEAGRQAGIAEHNATIAAENEARAVRQLNALYEEQGRHALLAEDAPRAMVYLSAAYSNGHDVPSLRFLLGRAMNHLRAHVRTFTGHLGPVAAARLSPDGRRLITRSADHYERVWDVESGRRLAVALSSRFGAGGGSTVSEDGRTAVSLVSRDGQRFDAAVALTDTPEQLRFLTVQGGEGMDDVLLSPDGRYVLGGATSIRINNSTTHLSATVLWDLNEADGPAFVFDKEITFGSALIAPGSRRALVMRQHTKGWSLHLLDLGARAVVKSIELKGAASPDVAFSANGARLMVARKPDRSTAEYVILNAADGGERRRVQFKTNDYAPEGVLDTTGKRLFMPSGKQCLMYDVSGDGGEADEPTRTFDNGDAPVASPIVISPDGRWLAATDFRGLVLWAVESGAVQFRTAAVAPSLQRVVRFAPDSGHIYAVDADGAVRFWRLPDGKPVGAVPSYTGKVNDAALSAAGDLLVTATADGEAIVWRWQDASPQPPRYSLLSGEAGDARVNHLPPGIVLSRDGLVAAAHVLADGRSDLCVFDLTAASPTRRVPLDDGSGQQFTTMAPDGRHVLVAQSGIILGGDTLRTVRVWPAASPGESVSLGPVWSHVALGRFASNANRLVTVERRGEHHPQGAAKVWDRQSGRLLAVLTHQEGLAQGAVLDAAGDMALTWTDTGDVHLWRIAAPHEPLQQLPRAGLVSAAAFSADGRRLAIGYAGGAIALHRDPWTADATDTRHHQGPINSLVFDRAGRRLLSASDDGKAIVCAADDGKLLTIVQQPRELAQPGLVPSSFTIDLSGRSFAIDRAWFSPDGRLIATVSMKRDRALQLWDADSGRLLANHALPVPNVAFSRGIENTRYTRAAFREDGGLIAITGDGVVAQFDTTPVRQSPQEVADWVNSHLPWRLHDGTLTPVESDE